jgi:hypothetical protein
MKKIALVVLASLLSINSFSQEWMTSLDVAKRLARVQDKMLFVMWGDAIDYEFPIVYRKEGSAIQLVTDLLRDEEVNELIWENFIPVLLYESTYADLFNEIKDTRSDKYIKKFQDDGIKIMDANGNILNTGYFSVDPFNFSNFVKRYGLSTAFLRGQLLNYAKKKNFNTTYSLGSKYLDYAIFVNRKVKEEITDLAIVYIDEANRLLDKETLENKDTLKQKCELLKQKKFLVLKSPRKVLRYLKKVEPASIDKVNEPIYAFLYYTSYQLIKDEKNAALWKSKVSLVDLKKAQLIINSSR